MPPSGFVRSSAFDAELSRPLILLAQVPSVVKPFIFDLEVRSVQCVEAKGTMIGGGSRAMPNRLLCLLDTHDAEEGVFLLINNLVYLLHELGKATTRLTTSPIDQAGGDAYLVRAGRQERRVDAGLRLSGVWRAWGDATGGAFGHKPKFDPLMGKQSSTSEGYEVGDRAPDLELSDPELEMLHLSAFAPIFDGS